MHSRTALMFMDGEQFFGFGTQSGAPGNNPEIPVIFFSRRIGLENGGIVPIVGGGRLLGRSGRNQTSADTQNRQLVDTSKPTIN